MASRLYREEGVVLRTHKLGEADHIVELVTVGRGKVRAVAKGVRKTSSKFGARLEPLTHVSLQLHEGRNLDIVTQAEVLDAFPAVRADLERLGKAMVVAEAVGHLAQEGEENRRLHDMLVGALRTLERRDPALLVPAFLWRLLAQEGVAPELDSCVACGEDVGTGQERSERGVDGVAFDLTAGGVLCREHRSGSPLSPGALELCRRILGGALNLALEEPDSSLTHEVDALATRAFESVVERRLRSPHLLDR